MTTWTQLSNDVQSWCARTDIATQLPTMCAIFEGRINRNIRVRQMEAAFSGTIATNVIALPADFLEFKRVWHDSYPDCPLKPQTLESVVQSVEGVPTLYALDGTNVRFNGTGSVTGVYYQKIPSLYVNATNWLSVTAYEAYLFGVLAEVATYQKDEAAHQVHYLRASAVLDSLSGADRRLNGPLVARAM